LQQDDPALGFSWDRAGAFSAGFAAVVAFPPPQQDEASGAFGAGVGCADLVSIVCSIAF